MEFANELFRSRWFRNYYDFEAIIDAPVLFAAAGAAAANTAVAPQSPEQVGVIKSETGTTAAGSAGWAGPFAGLRLDHGGKHTKHEQMIRSGATLSTGAEQYTIRCGLLDSVTAEPTDGAYFRYTDAATGAVWSCVTRANNVETVVASPIVFAVNTAYKLGVEVAGDASKAFFYINGVPVASQTLTIPTGAGRETSWGGFILKNAGGTTREYYTDYSDTVVVFR